MDARASLVVAREPGAVALLLRAARGELPQPAQEYTLAVLAARVRHVAAAPVTLGVRFAFPAPPDTAEHARVLGVEPGFGAPDAALVLPEGTWGAATRSADPGLFAALEVHARALVDRAAPEEDLAGRVRAAVAEVLPGREPSLAGVARRLGLSARTLQRRLGEAGTSFASLANGVRRARAEAFLAASDVSIAEVSWLVGFGEQSAFARAFRRWTGAAPSAWRERRRPPR